MKTDIFRSGKAARLPGYLLIVLSIMVLGACYSGGEDKPPAKKWREIQQTGVKGRSAYSAAIDDASNTIYYFGGVISDGQPVNQLFRLRLSPSVRFESLTASGVDAPTPRYFHNAAFDPVNRRMFICGGLNSEKAVITSLWEFDVDTLKWRQILTPTSLPRAAGMLVYDHMADAPTLYYFGGGDKNNLYNDLWVINPDTDYPDWRQVVTTGAAPGARNNFAYAYDADARKVYIHGGADSEQNRLSDFWALDLSGDPAWEEVIPEGDWPDARSEHSMFLVPTKSRLYFALGKTISNDPRKIPDGEYEYPIKLNEVFAYDIEGNKWLNISVGSTKPRSRSQAPLLYSTSEKKAYMFGGEGLKIKNDGEAIHPLYADIWSFKP